ncbi:hypothetical protein HA466_0088130 [Hirschfeldia incana]|nr:hypothetical protein HA466_0088130 [Hirschfeldia incana]
MKTSIGNFVCFVVFLSITAISLAKESPVEGCMRRNIAQALTPSPSDKPTTSNLNLTDELCKDETRIVRYFLELHGRFPRYYLKAMCSVFSNDETKVKDYVTSRWLDHSEKLLNSLSCITRTTLVIKKSPLETCIRRNNDEPSPLSLSRKKKVYHLDVVDIIGDDYCRDAARDILNFLELSGEFPPYYVQALCNVFEDEEKKVKEYVMKNWLYQSGKLIDSLSCSSL